MPRPRVESALPRLVIGIVTRSANQGVPVAKLYHTGTNAGIAPDDPDRLLAVVETFLTSSKTPAVLEYGEELMPLKPGEYALEVRSGKLWIDVWHGNRSLSRRILSVEHASTGTLDCLIHRF